MRAWLEVVEPSGADHELDPQRDFYVGRKKTNDLVVALPDLGESQFIVRFEKDGWRLIDLHGTPWSRIVVNGARMVDRHRLQDGDDVRIHGLRVRFREEQAAPTHTFDALRANPDDDDLWQVHADELQERGDAFGEYLAHALRGETPDHTPWLDEIFQRESFHGSLTLSWRRGVIESAIMRRRGLYDRFDLAHFRLLVQSRVGQFLRHLTIEEGTPALAEGLARLDELPPTLETLNLGYQLGPKLHAQAAPETLRRRCPRLREVPVFVTTPGLKLRSEQQTVVLLRPCRFIRNEDGSLSLGEEERLPSLASFTIKEGCFWLRGDFAGTTQLNSRHGRSPIKLLLGDELSLRTGHRFRVEPNDTLDNHYEEPRSPEPEAREWGGAL